MNKEQLVQKMKQFFQQQNWQDMLQLCNQGLQSYPNDINLHYHKAISMSQLGHLQETKKYLEQILKAKLR